MQQAHDVNIMFFDCIKFSVKFLSNNTFIYFFFVYLFSGNVVLVVHTTKQSVLFFDRMCFVLLHFSGFRAYVIKSGLNEDLSLFVCLSNDIQAFDWRLDQNDSSAYTHEHSHTQHFISVLLLLTTEISDFFLYSILAIWNNSHFSNNWLIANDR